MLSCERFIERLYDADCRRAMEAGRSAPPDVAEHMAACAECRRAWEEARSDACSLPGLLGRPSPMDLERRLRIRLAEPVPRARLDWLGRAAWWSAVGAAAALAAARALPEELAGVGPVVLAFAGASIAFVAGTLREALGGPTSAL